MIKSRDPMAGLSARERELMDIIFRLGEATAAEARDEMADPPTDATVRSTLRVMEKKGLIAHGRDGARYVWTAAEPKDRVRTHALGHVVRTFFDGSPAEVVSALVGARAKQLSSEERERIRDLLQELDSE